MDPVSELVDQLEENPNRFRETDGYGRLVSLLERGYPGDAVRRVLQKKDPGFAGDLLWVVAELEDVTPFVSEAVRHLASPDKGTAAYAMEVVLRGARDGSECREALQRLCCCDVVVCKAAVQTLAVEGLARLQEILEKAGWTWSTALAKVLSSQPVPRELFESLVADPSCDRQVVGAALCTLAYEQDAAYVKFLTRSEHAWIREYGNRLAARAGRDPR
ncbi:hypothetical protein [Pendulispora rubella]|uniref:hypothetical protein n=1 Tax=Pendulispora rubella TaxID=2741070 RepID=UPI0030E15E64